MFALTAFTLAKILLPIAGLLLAGPVGRYWRRVGERPPRIEGERIVLRSPRVLVAAMHVCALVS